MKGGGVVKHVLADQVQPGDFVMIRGVKLIVVHAFPAFEDEDHQVRLVVQAARDGATNPAFYELVNVYCDPEEEMIVV